MTGAPPGSGDQEFVPGPGEEPPQGGSERFPAGDDALAAALEQELADYTATHPAPGSPAGGVTPAPPVSPSPPGWYEPPPEFSPGPVIEPPTDYITEPAPLTDPEPELPPMFPGTEQGSASAEGAFVLDDAASPASVLEELQRQLWQQAGSMPPPVPPPTAPPAYGPPPTAAPPASQPPPPPGYGPGGQPSPPPPPSDGLRATPPPPPGEDVMARLASMPPPVGVDPATHLPPPPAALTAPPPSAAPLAPAVESPPPPLVEPLVEPAVPVLPEPVAAPDLDAPSAEAPVFAPPAFDPSAFAPPSEPPVAEPAPPVLEPPGLVHVPDPPAFAPPAFDPSAFAPPAATDVSVPDVPVLDAPLFEAPVAAPAPAPVAAPETVVPEPPAPAAPDAPTRRRAFADPFAEDEAIEEAEDAGMAAEPVPPTPAPPDPFPPGPAPAADDPAEPPATGGGAAPFASSGDAAPTADPDDPDDAAVDDVDRVDRASEFAAALTAAGASHAAASEPVAHSLPVSVAGDEAASGAEVRTRRGLGAGEIETTGVEPTPLDRRAAHSSRLFWLWFAPNASVLALGVGAILAASGISLRQAIVAALAGVAVAFLPLGLGTLAGKWTGQPVMVVSRAVFGHLGNLLPAFVSLLVRAFWGAALIWIFASSTARLLGVAGADLGLGREAWILVGVAVAAIVVAVVAVIGYGLLQLVHTIATVVSAVLIAGLIAVTAPRLDLAAALQRGDGPWWGVMAGGVLVFSLVGVAWTQSTGDLARYQRPEGWGGSSMLWATLSATLPAFAIIAWGALLAASDPELGAGLASDPVGALAGILPAWYPVPLLAAIGIGLLSAAVLSVYSGGFVLLSLGIRLRRVTATLVVALLAVGGAIAFGRSAAEPGALLQDSATALAVPVSAWLGVFAAEMMIRSRGFHASSLLRRGGRYPDLRWVSLATLVAASFVGFGLSHGRLPGLDWQGFLFRWAGLDPAGPVATSDLGVPVALLLAFVVAFATARPAIRRQERSRAARSPVAPPAPAPETAS